MKAAKALDRFQRTLDSWRGHLAGLEADDFGHPPPGGGWTIGQICDHIGRVAKRMFDEIRAIDEGRCEDHGFSPGPAFLTAFPSFPPIRLKFPIDKAPDDWKLLGQPNPLTRSEAMHVLDDLEQAAGELAEPAATASRRARTRHFAFGWVHAAQWFKIAEMHTRHHLRQLKRAMA